MTPGPVWIDLANSPHVLFFAPVLAELGRRGVPVVVTARAFAQTVELCALFGVEAEVIGEHGGAGLAGKASTLAARVRGLRAFAARTAPSVAVSHNSYAQAVAARSLGIPVVTAMDYEFQPANHLAFRCAALVAVPDLFPLDALRHQGVGEGRVWRYHGLKEHIALAGFTPDPAFRAALGLDDAQAAAGAPGPAAAGRALVVVRPPARFALYHRFENPLFGRLLRRLADDPALRVVVLPRTPAQAADLERDGFGALLWRGEAPDGRQLVAAADAVVSAGGSMNREAAVLGTPAYSVYAGRLAAVDRALAAGGRLTLLATPADVDALRIGRKPAAPPARVGDALVRELADRVMAAGSGGPPT